jgi:ADP-heptose:LPS heptosyltransferase
VILALRALGVGDLAAAVPALRGLRAAFPDRALVLAAPQWLAPLADLVGAVDRLVPANGLEPRDWPVPPPHRAVNLHGSGPQSHLLLRRSDPAQLWAFACPPAGHLDGPPWIDDEHEVDRWCRLLRWYGVPADPADLGLRRPSAERVPVGATIVHPGGKERRRRWSPGRFAALARVLDRHGHRVVVTGSSAERDLAAGVAAQAGLPATAVLAGRMGLTDLAALVAHGRLLVSADTGIGHLATAYGTPSVLLFGPVSPRRWGPPDDHPWHRVLWHEHLAGALDVGAGPGRVENVGAGPGRVEAEGSGSGARTHPALAAIQVEDVLEAIGEVERIDRVRHAVAAH